MEETNSKRRKGLKALRETKGLTQAELAYALRTAEKTVRNWENEQAIPSFDRAVALAKILNVPLKALALEFGLDVNGVPDDSENQE